MPDENSTPTPPAVIVPPYDEPKMELLKTRSLEEDGPGAGGWTPGSKTPIWASILAGVAASTVPVLLSPSPTWNVIAASVIAGAATGCATYFGMRSAGPRT